MNEKSLESAPEDAGQGTIGQRTKGSDDHSSSAAEEAPRTERGKPEKAREIGGPKGLEPTRYGDWEKGGRCIDF